MTLLRYKALRQNGITNQDNSIPFKANAIAKAITDNVSIEVTYNEEYGYPEIAKIDLEKLAVDGGLHINLSNLEFKDSKLSLDDVTWTLESFYSIAGPQPILENTNISLSFDMQLNGAGGCNTIPS
jgi:hypothetical protein